MSSTVFQAFTKLPFLPKNHINDHRTHNGISLPSKFHPAVVKFYRCNIPKRPIKVAPTQTDSHLAAKIKPKSRRIPSWPLEYLSGSMQFCSQYPCWKNVVSRRYGPFRPGSHKQPSSGTGLLTIKLILRFQENIFTRRWRGSFEKGRILFCPLANTKTYPFIDCSTYS